MEDEKIAEDIRRGEQARMILENPIYADAVDKVRSAIITAWQNAPIRDKEGQHELKLMLKALEDVNKAIENVMQTGKLAMLEQERNSWKEKAQTFFNRHARRF